MAYIYRVRRSEPASPLAVTPSKAGVVAAIPAEELESTAVELTEPSYRDLQAQAKARGIKANQPADKLKKALGVGNG